MYVEPCARARGCGGEMPPPDSTLMVPLSPPGTPGGEGGEGV